MIGLNRFESNSKRFIRVQTVHSRALRFIVCLPPKLPGAAKQNCSLKQRRSLFDLGNRHGAESVDYSWVVPFLATHTTAKLEGFCCILLHIRKGQMLKSVFFAATLLALVGESKAQSCLACLT